MKAIICNLCFLLVWIIVGHFFPIFYLVMTGLIYPFLFILTAILLKYNLNGFIVIPFGFILIYTSDYLFRIYGGGIHDDVSRGLCEIVFYFTLLTTTIALEFVLYICTKQRNAQKNINKIGKIKIFMNICYVLIISLITLLIFWQTTIFI